MRAKRILLAALLVIGAASIVLPGLSERHVRLHAESRGENPALHQSESILVEPGVWVGAFVLELLLLVVLVVLTAVAFWRSARVVGSVGAFVMVLALASIALAWTRAEPGGRSFLRGFERWVQSEVELPAIRQWRSELASRSPGEVGAGDWPDFVQRVAPIAVMLRDGGSLELMWGGGFEHWGIVVGPVEGQGMQPGWVFTERLEKDVLIFVGP